MKKQPRVHTTVYLCESEVACLALRPAEQSISAFVLCLVRDFILAGVPFTGVALVTGRRRGRSISLPKGLVDGVKALAPTVKLGDVIRTLIARQSPTGCVQAGAERRRVLISVPNAVPLTSEQDLIESMGFLYPKVCGRDTGVRVIEVALSLPTVEAVDRRRGLVPLAQFLSTALATREEVRARQRERSSTPRWVFPDPRPWYPAFTAEFWPDGTTVVEDPGNPAWEPAITREVSAVHQPLLVLCCAPNAETAPMVDTFHQMIYRAAAAAGVPTTLTAVHLVLADGSLLAVVRISPRP
jgi:hypothetical protein